VQLTLLVTEVKFSCFMVDWLPGLAAVNVIVMSSASCCTSAIKSDEEIILEQIF
jgi:hypothetical protein